MTGPSVSFSPPDATSRALRSLVLWSAIPLLVIMATLPAATGLRSFTFPLALLGFVLWRSWRMSRIALEIHPDGVILRNVLRTHRIQWSEISQIGVNLSAPPEDLIRGALGLPADEDSASLIPEHRRIFDHSDGITKFIVSIVFVVRGRSIAADSVTADSVEALAFSWKAQQEARQVNAMAPRSEWDKVISSEELDEWFRKEAPPDEGA
jgi:hypothetical protein